MDLISMLVAQGAIDTICNTVSFCVLVICVAWILN